jgi:hypothetical protein
MDAVPNKNAPLLVDGEGEGVSDEDLFKEPPPNDECPICMLTLPLEAQMSQYQGCCGKMICMGCAHAEYMEHNRTICPFCRTPAHTSVRERVQRLQKRAEEEDANAMRNLGCLYHDGEMGLPRNRNKAYKLLLRAGELGDAMAYGNIAHIYEKGEGVEKDMKKAIYYSELAAMGGAVKSRHALGILEIRAGNLDRAAKHWMISAAAGLDDSLKEIQKGYVNGHVTKDEFEKALRAHKQAKDEVKSDQRDTAAVYYYQNQHY